MVLVEIVNKIQEKFYSWGFNAVDFIPNLVLAIIIIIFGIFAGKFIKWLLNKILIKGFKLNKIFRFGFIETSLIAIKWVIYILFFQYSLTILDLPFLSEYLSRGLGIIPGVISSVIIVIVGYAIAIFLKRGFIRTEKEGMVLLGDILFIFVLYVSITIALITAFAGIGNITSNTILIISAIAIAGLIWLNKNILKK